MRSQTFVLCVCLSLLVACGDGTGSKSSSDKGDPSTVASRDGRSTDKRASAVPPSASVGGLSKFEHSLVDPILEDIRHGVRPFNPSGIGLCKGVGKECSDFLGNTPGELPKGEYMVRAELRVPRVGPAGTWKITFTTECATTIQRNNTETTSTNNYTQTYDVRYTGEKRGYRLSPLKKITSPNKAGAQTCQYRLVAPHPDGDKVYEGRWSVPGPA